MKRRALAVKFVNEEEGIIEGWGAPYGGPLAGKDMQGEFFTPNTDFCLDWFPQRPVLYHHGLDATKGIEVCGTQIGAEVRDAGLWIECQLNKSQKYWEQIKAMIKSGTLFFSSGALPHLVEKKSTGEITRWPTLEFTLTPTPANPMATIESLKAVVLPDDDTKGDDAGTLGENQIIHKDGDMKTKATKSDVPEEEDEKKPVPAPEDEPAEEAPAEDAPPPPPAEEPPAEDATGEAPPAPPSAPPPAAAEAVPQLPPQVVEALVTLKNSVEACLGGQQSAPPAPDAVKFDESEHPRADDGKFTSGGGGGGGGSDGGGEKKGPSGGYSRFSAEPKHDDLDSREAARTSRYAEVIKKRQANNQRRDEEVNARNHALRNGGTVDEKLFKEQEDRYTDEDRAIDSERYEIDKERIADHDEGQNREIAAFSDVSDEELDGLFSGVMEANQSLIDRGVGEAEPESRGVATAYRRISNEKFRRDDVKREAELAAERAYYTAKYPAENKSTKSLDTSGLKAELDGITKSLKGATETMASAIKGFEERLSKIEATPAHEGPVLRDAKSINPRMEDASPNEARAMLQALQHEATDPVVKAFLGQKAAEMEIKTIFEQGPKPIRGYNPSIP